MDCDDIDLRLDKQKEKQIIKAKYLVFDTWRRRVEKPSLKLNIQDTKIMASCSITPWQIYGKTVADFIFLASGPITSRPIDGETLKKLVDVNFWAPKSLQMVIATMKLKDTYILKRKLRPI